MPDKSPRVCEWTEEQKAKACGKYVSGEGTVITVGREGDGLTLDIAGEKPPFVTTAPDVIIVRNPYSDADMIFISGDDGRPWAVRFGGRIIPRTE